MEIRQFVEKKINDNDLNIDIEWCLKTIKQYENLYPNTNEKHRFFYVLLNLVGAFLHDADEDLGEVLGWIKVGNIKDVYFFKFSDEEDYLNWLQARIYLYEHVVASGNKENLRLLNYLELSILNFIKDITTNCTYEIIKTTTYTVRKEGFGNNFNQLSFIKYLVGKFNDGYLFKPVVNV